MNIERSPIILREYGRNIQKMAHEVLKIEQREERSKNASKLVKLIKQLNPAFRDNSEFDHKVWDDLHIMLDGGLDIDAPYPAPEKDSLYRKPKPMEHGQGDLAYRHHGRKMLQLILKISEIEDQQQRMKGIQFAGKLMKTISYARGQSISNEEILRVMKTVSKGTINLEDGSVPVQNLFEVGEWKRERREKPAGRGPKPRNQNGEDPGRQLAYP